MTGFVSALMVTLVASVTSVSVSAGGAPHLAPAPEPQEQVKTPTMQPAPPPASPPTTTPSGPPTPVATPVPVGPASPPAPVDPSLLHASWRPGCPVPVEDLRLLTFSHWGFDGAVHTGEIVVHHDEAEAVLGAFGRLYELGFPIEQIRLVDEFGGDDDASMAANNTSAFNCRRVAGTKRWSQHAYGRALDVNPLQNPYVTRRGPQPPAGAAYLNRAEHRQGMVTPEVIDAFAAVGWEWGGRWSRPDYQHFSATGG